MTPEMLASVSERRRLDPLTCLLMWLMALNADPVREALRLLEVSADEIYNMFSGLEYEQAQMRRLRMVCELFTREHLGKLARGRLTEMLMQCQKPADCAALLRAAGQLPDWVLDDRPGVVNVWDDQGQPFERPDIAARAAAQAFADAGVPLDFAGGAEGNGPAQDGNGTEQNDECEQATGLDAADQSSSPSGIGAPDGSGSLNGGENSEDGELQALADLGPLSAAEETLLAGALADLVIEQAKNGAKKPKRKPQLPRRR